MLWIVRKNHRDLTLEERQRLRTLFPYAPRLKTAYTLREELTTPFEMALTQALAQCRFRKWMAKVRRSDLTCFEAFLTTLDNRFEQTTNYFHDRRSRDFVEGLNNKLKTLKRRC